jgi:phosphohistidine swiveling domain-containing protein
MKKLSLQGWRARPKDTISIHPSIYTMSYATSEKCRQIYGAKLKSAIYALYEQNIYILMETQADYEKFSHLLVNKFKKQSQYLGKLISWSEQQINSFYFSINKNLGAEIIEKLSNQEIAKHYLEYAKQYVAFHFRNTPAWWLGALAAEEELKKYLQNNYPKRDVNVLLSTIIAPLEYPTENFQEEMSLLSIAIKLQRQGIYKIKNYQTLPEKIKTELDRHIQQYSSLPFGYNTGVVWRAQDFVKRLRLMLKKNSATEKAIKLKEIKNKKIIRDKTLVNLKLPAPIYNLVIALRQLAYLQELKKTTQTRSHPLLQMTVKPEIARRLKIEPKHLDYADALEVANFLEAGCLSSAQRKSLIAREICSVVFIRHEKLSWLVGREALQFMKVNGLLIAANHAKEIKGQPAAHGLVRGRVKICRTSNEINKIKTGDILVTAMTTPDFVPAMRRAAGIITDEGGITSHAAIVARELKKPCVIGTKVATQILHDGDMVELNANQGIIKILTK